MISLAFADTKISVNTNILLKHAQRKNAKTKNVRKDIQKSVDMMKDSNI